MFLPERSEGGKTRITENQNEIPFYPHEFQQVVIQGTLCHVVNVTELELGKMKSLLQATAVSYKAFMA